VAQAPRDLSGETPSEAHRLDDFDALDEREAPDEKADAEGEEAEEDDARGRQVLSVYLREISGIPLLSRDEEIELAKRVAKGDREAEQRMVEATLRLVVEIARDYVGRGLSLLDVIEEGNLGLLRGVRTYRCDRGTRFPVHATWWIRQAIVRAVATQARATRLPVQVGALLAKYLRAKERLAEETQRPPTLGEIAAAMNLPAEQLEGLEEVAATPLSLETPVGRGRGVSRPDLMPRGAGAGSDVLAGLLRERQGLRDILDSLPPDERTVIALRFGLDGEAPMAPGVIGQRMGAGREQIRQVEASALRRLRARLAARGIDLAD